MLAGPFGLLNSLAQCASEIFQRLGCARAKKYCIVATTEKLIAQRFTLNANSGERAGTPQYLPAESFSNSLFDSTYSPFNVFHNSLAKILC